MSTKQIEDLSDYEIARWSALIIGIDKIADMADAKALDFNTIHIDQPALDKFVDEISDDVLFAMQSKEILSEIDERSLTNY